MTVTAIFSNGYKDVYKGKRPVTAAWMVVHTATGAIISSGHSLDVVKARKTAEGYLAYCGAVLGEGHPLRTLQWTGTRGGSGMSANERARARAHNAARLAAIRPLVTIEVIEL